MASVKSVTGSLQIILLLLFISFLFFSCSDDSAPTAPDLSLDEKLQKTLEDGIVNYDGKGVSVAVIFPEGDTWLGTAGVSHGSVPITSDMIFSAGSITKTFTACTIMQLAEENRLSLDDSLHKWLPAYENIDSNITIRQLLNHTCGIYDIAENEQMFEMMFSNTERILTMDGILREYVREPGFSPGTGWAYSNTGYLLLRMIIQNVTGSEISAEYRNRFLNRLNLGRTYLSPEENCPSPVAHGWQDLNGDGTEEELHGNSMKSFYSAAGGGIFTTAGDLAHWARALFNEGTAVSHNCIEQMTEFTPTAGQELLSGYGLGIERFNTELFDGLEIWGHGGDPVGYAAGCFYIPQYGISIGIMDNTGDGKSMNVIFDIIDVIKTSQ